MGIIPKLDSDPEGERQKLLDMAKEVETSNSAYKKAQTIERILDHLRTGFENTNIANIDAQNHIAESAAERGIDPTAMLDKNDRDLGGSHDSLKQIFDIWKEVEELFHKHDTLRGNLYRSQESLRRHPEDEVSKIEVQRYGRRLPRVERRLKNVLEIAKIALEEGDFSGLAA